MVYYLFIINDMLGEPRATLHSPVSLLEWKLDFENVLSYWNNQGKDWHKICWEGLWSAEEELLIIYL